jgi:uncharacterized protein (TIGR03643 family)
MTEPEISRVIEMAWEDRTPFEAIKTQFGLNQEQVIIIMRGALKTCSFKLWRARTRGRATKHSRLRPTSMNDGSKHRASHRIPQQ